MLISITICLILCDCERRAELDEGLGAVCTFMFVSLLTASNLTTELHTLITTEASCGIHR